MIRNEYFRLYKFVVVNLIILQQTAIQVIWAEYIISSGSGNLHLDSFFQYVLFPSLLLRISAILIRGNKYFQLSKYY